VIWIGIAECHLAALLRPGALSQKSSIGLKTLVWLKVLCLTGSIVDACRLHQRLPSSRCPVLQPLLGLAQVSMLLLQSLNTPL
jgi:hypothetical protein